MERCITAAIDGFVAKPVRVEDLFAEFDRVLNADKGLIGGSPVTVSRLSILRRAYRDPKCRDIGSHRRVKHLTFWGSPDSLQGREGVCAARLGF